MRSKVRSNFRLLGLSSDLGSVMLDREQVLNAYRGGWAYYFRRSPEVKGQVKFQVARIELKFGEGDAGPRASAKCIGLSRRMPSKVK